MTAKKYSTMFLYTVNFPYGNSEPYLHNALQYLSKYFQKVYIIPNTRESGNCDLPKNVEVKFLQEYTCEKGRKTLFVLNFCAIVRIMLTEFKHCEEKPYFIKRSRYYLNELLNAIELSEKIKQLPKFNNEDTLHYSFWMNNWALALALLKRKGYIDEFVFRVHGFDLYKERWPNDFIPFRRTCYQYTKAIFPISMLGQSYIKKNFKFSEKAKVFYLGTEDSGENPKVSLDHIHVVSCSNFVPVKRLHLLALAFSSCKVKLKWTHIGGYTEAEMEKLKPFLDNIKENVEVRMVGHLPQNELKDFYRSEPVTLFINVSESEGIPVSIMEAISFGIPILATNVGAIHEIVTKETGVLVEKDIQPTELMKAIVDLSRSNYTTTESAIRIKNFWRKHFEASTNYNTFYEHLANLKIWDKKSEREWRRIYKYSCTHCVLSTEDDSKITFDENGVCNYCTTFEKEFARYYSISLEERTAQLKRIAEKIKIEGKGAKYDCLVGVSGGVDSSFVAIKAYELGLNALLIHFDNGWNSELAVKNIEQISKHTGFDLFTYVVDWNEFKDLQRSYIKAGVLDWEVPTDHGLWAITIKKAKEMNIKYVLTGFNYQTEGILPKPMRYDKADLKNLKDIYNRYGKGGSFKSFPTYNFWHHQYLRLIWGLQIEPILCYLDYDKTEAKNYLIEKAGWRDYGGKHYESIFTRFYQGYALYEKFGVDKRKAHLASMICSRKITRDEAFAELNKPMLDPEIMKEDLRFFLKKLEFSESEFRQIMNAKPVKHEVFNSYSKFDYPIFRYCLPKLIALKNLFKPSKN